MATTARHETRALLRAHLSAASGYRHLTRHCPICHQLLRLAMEPGPRAVEPAPRAVDPAPRAVEDPEAPAEDESPATA
ncbi:DUF6274 family protein [Streptomyces sp. NPDC058371]|uniref:DUF6274 family protein n=1 Tax=Streptomyces sp. NPDC058371 TaxID=3346463 RepID=UPI0036497886